MPPKTITLELPERRYRTVSTLAQVTKRPLAEVLHESLAHTLPPLDDVPAEEAEVLAHAWLLLARRGHNVPVQRP